MSISLAGFCNPLHPAMASLAKLSLDDGLEPSLSDMAGYRAVIDHDGVKFFTKVYVGRYAGILHKRIALLSEAISRVVRLAATGARSVEELTNQLLNRGVAVTVSICHTRVTDGGVIEDRSLTLIYPYVEGSSLYDLASADGGKMPLSKAKEAYCAFVEAASLVESAGVIHGDLNPGNVLYRSLGGHLRAVVIDFDGAITKVKIKMGLGPAFVFNIDEGNVVLKPAEDLYALDNIKYIDYAQLVYDGLEFLLRSEVADVVEKTDFTRPVEKDSARALADALGGRFVEHVNRVINADFRGLDPAPIRRLLEDLKGDGVCR